MSSLEKMEDSMQAPLVGHPSVLKTVASYIIVTEFAERLAYYGFAGSLVLFFEAQLNMSNEDSMNQFYLWNGAVYVTPLIGGYIADTFLGRYTTILYFAVLYVVGLVLFLLGAVPGHISSALIFSGMYIVALGAGGIKPNCSTMGADQFDAKDPQDAKEVKQFFSYFYWSINLGALVSYTLIAYICQYGLAGLGGAKWGFFVGYMLPTIALGVGIAVFMSGSARYVKHTPKGSMVSRAMQIMWEAGITRRGMAKQQYGTQHWLDNASNEFGGSFSTADVNSVKYVTRLVPFLVVLIPYWGIYGQTKTAFQIQGCQMLSKVGSFQLPVSGMNIFNNIAILALVPLFELTLYPYMKSQGRELTMLWKIGLGFLFAVSAMVVAALIEQYRLDQAPPEVLWIDATQQEKDNCSPCRDIDNYDPYKYLDWMTGGSSDKPSNCWEVPTGCPNPPTVDCIACDPIPQMSDISIFWQVPQFMLVGISEIFAMITSLEFFYSQAPMSMRSVSQALNLFTNAVGSWLTIPLTMLVNSDPDNPWVTDNVNEGHLEWYFFLLAGIMLATFFIYTQVCDGFEYSDPEDLDILNQQCSAEEELRQHGESSKRLFDESSHTNSNLGPAVRRSTSNHSGNSLAVGEEF